MWSRAHREVREGIIDQLPAMVGTSLTAPVRLARVPSMPEGRRPERQASAGRCAKALERIELFRLDADAFGERTRAVDVAPVAG